MLKIDHIDCSQYRSYHEPSLVCATIGGITYRTKPMFTARLSPTNSLMPINKCSSSHVFKVATRSGKCNNFQHHSWWKLIRLWKFSVIHSPAILMLAMKLSCSLLVSIAENRHTAQSSASSSSVLVRLPYRTAAWTQSHLACSCSMTRSSMRSNNNVRGSHIDRVRDSISRRG